MEADQQSQEPKGPPDTVDLFLASLIATAMVYITGITLIAALIGFTSLANGFVQGFTFFMFFATFGAGAALFAAFLLVVPLGTAWGRLMVRLTPPAWWQGPLTGLLVALSLVALTLLMFGFASQPLDWGTYAIAAVPVVLAPFAGAYVQQRVLRWPANA